jgi:hypothetical protein
MEAREQALAEAEAEFEARSTELRRREEKADAAEKGRAEETERVRRAASELAARERALTEGQAELARRSEPPPVPTGFLAGLDALATASHERRTRRDQQS